jgi:nitrate reductase gamma subunit
VLAFRSLFRNTKVELKADGERVLYHSDKLLWAGALAFHWAFLFIFIRHMRFFLEPVPALVHWMESADGFFQLTAPTFLVTDALILAALLYLLGRRLFNPQVRYISLPADYFALFVLLAVVVTGILMRYVTKVDLLAVKQMSLGLVTLSPVVPEGGAPLPFMLHLFMVCVLFAYFPFSKLVHLGGVFLSPTRNMANDNRMRRHVNPLNPEVEPHTYPEWEEEFKDKLEAAGIPLDAVGGK